MKIGWDIDGCLASQDVVNICLMKGKPEVEKLYYQTVIPIAHPEMYASPEDEVILITGRKEEYREITELWCKKWFPQYKFIITPTVTWKSEAEWESWFLQVAVNKSKVINELKLDIYFEDMPPTVIALRKLCPNCKIIQFGGRI